MNGLDYIKNVLDGFTAIEFAEYKLGLAKSETGDDYEEYMSDMYAGDLANCEKLAFCSHLDNYAQCIEIYSGWVKNGKVFIMDKRDKVIFALYSKDDKSHQAYTHYNPLEVDVISYGMGNVFLVEGIDSGRYELSANEAELIIELNKLIESSKFPS